MKYIGLSSGFHDAGLTVVDDKGEILFAGHSERYSKKKHDANLCEDIIAEAVKMQPVTSLSCTTMKNHG